MYEDVLDKLKEETMAVRKDLDTRFDKQAALVKWAIGIFVGVVLTYTGYVSVSLSSSAAKLNDHMMDHEAHSTRNERRMTERADEVWRVAITTRLESIELKLDRLDNRR